MAKTQITSILVESLRAEREDEVTEKFKIEKNVPIPPKNRNGVGPKYPWPDMKVNDSFFAPDRKIQNFSAPRLYARKHNMKFKCRTVDGGVRVWRVK